MGLRILSWMSLVLCVTLATAGPLRSRTAKLSSCSRHCRAPGERKFYYLPDNVYEFTYRTETVTHVQHATQHSARVVIEATAHVHVLSTCEMVLKLREVKILESDPTAPDNLRKSDNSRVFRDELERESLRFAFQDGGIPDICPSEGEETWTLNVKRGFLSVFQNSMDNMDKAQTVLESDVIGECPTQYSEASTGWFTRSVRKTRDLANCTRPFVYSASVPGLLHHLQSSSSLLTGRQECTQSVDWNGLLNSATCTERHHFRPMTGEGTDAGIMTTVSQNVQFLEQRTRGKFSPPVSRRMSMAYEHTSKRDTNKNEAIRTMKSQLRDLCDSDDVSPSTPDLFYDLVTSMRRMDISGLRLVYELVSGTSICSDNRRTRKFFIDALSAAGTDASVRMLTRLMVSGDVTGTDVVFWLMPLTFLPRPSPSMLQTVKNLLESKHVWREALLPVSGLVNNYCRRHRNCDSDPDVQRIMLTLKRIVGNQCHASHANVEKIVLGVRAIANSGQAGHVAEVLDNCLKRKNNPTEVRVSAAQALRRIPCDAKRQRLWRVFGDQAEDSELRIAAYVTIMQCVTQEVLHGVQRTLAGEKDPQVVSYVYTHLANLKVKDGSYRQEMSELMETLKVNRSMSDMGGFQTSRNLAGVPWSQSDISLHTDTNIVWPTSIPSSTWLPRSADVSVTMEILGRALNLVEVGVREEGVAFFLQDVVLPYLGQKRKSVGPNKRLLQLSQLKGSLYAKVLGNEITFQRLAATGKWAEQLASGKRLSVKDVLAKIFKQGKLNFGQNMVLLDVSMTVPTSCGLPLTVSVNGSASLQLHASGTVDLRRVFSKPRRLDVNGEMRASGAVRMSGTMSVDGIVSRAGVRMTGTVHSNTLLRGHVKVEQGSIVSLQVDVPADNMDIFTVRSDFFLLHNQVQQHLLPSDVTQRMISACTGPTAARVTGLELCGQVRFPNEADKVGVAGLLRGPASASVVLYKRDSHASYTLFAKHIKTKHSVDTQLTFSTPGARVDRTLAAELQVNVKQRNLRIGFTSPWKKAEVSGSLSNTARLKGTRCTLVIDKVTYGVIAEVKVTKSHGDVIYSPVFEIHRPGTDVVALTAAAKLGRHWKKVGLDLSLSGVADDPLKMTVSVTNKKQEVSVKVSATHGVAVTYSLAAGTFMSVTGRGSPKVEVNPFFFLNTPSRQLISLTGRGDYRKDRMFRVDVKLSVDGIRPLELQYALIKTPTRKLDRYRLDFAVRSSVAMVTCDANVDVKPGHMLNARVTLTHNVPTVMPADTVVMVMKLNDRSTSSSLNYIVALKMESTTYPDHSFDLKLTTEHRPKDSRTRLLVKYGDDHVQYALLNSKIKHDVTDIYTVALATKTDVQVPARDVNIRVQASHKHSPKLLESRVTLDEGQGHRTRARLMFADRSKTFLTLVGRAVLDTTHDEDTTTTPPRTGTKSKARSKDPSVSASFKLVEDSDQYDVKSGAYLGRKKRDFSTSINIKKPLSLQRVQMFLKAHGVKTYNELEAEVSHEMHPFLAGLIKSLFEDTQHAMDYATSVRLLSSLEGAEILNKEEDGFRNATTVDDFANILNKIRTGLVPRSEPTASDSDEDGGRKMKTNLKGGYRLKSSFVDLLSSSLNFAHKFDGEKYSSGVNVDQNGDQYGAAVTMTDHIQNWHRKSLGKVTVTVPDRSVSVEWNHELAQRKMRSTFMSSWASNRKVYLDFNGQHEATNETQEITSDVVVQTPWRPIRDWRVSFGQEIASDSFRSKSTIRQSGVKHISHHVTMVHTLSYTDATVIIYTPWTRKVSGAVRTRYDAYPVTATIELAWPVRQKLSATSSVTFNSWDDLDLFLNMKTSLYGLRPVVYEISNKMYGENMVSEMSFNYGLSTTLSAESSLRLTDFTRWRLKVLTPLKNCRVLETGFEAVGNFTEFSSRADFRIFPTVGKYQCDLKWKMDETFSGSLNVDTPLKHFPYFQLTAVSQNEKGSGFRLTNVTASYHPNKQYLLKSRHTRHPHFLIEADVTTPLPEFDRITTAIHCVQNTSYFQFDAYAKYPPEQLVKAGIILELANTESNHTTGSVVILTPFSSVEQFEMDFASSRDMASFSGNASVTHNSHFSQTLVLVEKTMERLNARLHVQTPSMPHILVSISNSTSTPNSVVSEMHVMYGGNFSLGGVSLEQGIGTTEPESSLSSSQAMDASVVLHVCHSLASEESVGHVKLLTTIPNIPNVSVSYSVLGQADNLTLTGHVMMEDTPTLNVSISHTHDTGVFNSSLNLSTVYMDDLNIHLAYKNDTERFLSHLSVVLGNTHEVVCYTDVAFNNMTEVDSLLRMKSPATGRIHNAFNIAVNKSAPTENFSFVVQFNRSGDFVSDAMDTYRLGLRHRGRADNFETELSVKPLHGKSLETSVQWIYLSPFQLKSSVSFRSPFRRAEDLSLQIYNTESGQQKQSVLSFGWAPYRKVMLDATFRNHSTVTIVDHQLDVIVVTPFEGLQTCAVRLGHSQFMTRSTDKVEVDVNGKKLATMKLTATDVSFPTVRQTGLPVLDTRTLVVPVTGGVYDTELFLNWDITNSSKNLRLTSKVKSYSDLHVSERDVHFTVVHPTLSTSLQYSLSANTSTVSGEGGLTVSRGHTGNTTNRFSYVYRLHSANSASYTSNGMLKLGSPWRAVEASGSWRDERQAGGSIHGQRSQEVDGTLLWDADGDRKKHADLVSRVTSGPGISVDVMIAVPTVQRELRIQHDFLRNHGDTVWNVTSRMAFTPDLSKALTFSGSVLNTGTAGTVNYTLATALALPYADLDLGCISELKMDNVTYSTAWRAWYVTASQRRDDITIRATIHRLRKEIRLQAETPNTRLWADVKKLGQEPYHVTLSGSLHTANNNTNNPVHKLTSDLIADATSRSVVFKTSFDDALHSFAVEAKYVNDSAVRAEVYRSHATGRETDAMLALRLNTSTLIHARLTWRPSLLGDIQMLYGDVAIHLADLELYTREIVSHVTQNVGDEISAKYSSMTSLMVQEVTPVVHFLDTELRIVGEGLELIVSGMETVYLANQQLLKSVGRGLDGAGEYLILSGQGLTMAYKEFHTQLVQDLHVFLDATKHFPINQHYWRLLSTIADAVRTAGRSSAETLEEMLAVIDQYLPAARRRMLHFRNNISVHETLQQGLLTSLDRYPVLQSVATTANELYSQSWWVLDYWHVGHRVQRHLASISHSLQQLLLAELHSRLRHFRTLHGSRVTFWGPAQGEVQAELALPLPIISLYSRVAPHEH